MDDETRQEVPWEVLKEKLKEQWLNDPERVKRGEECWANAAEEKRELEALEEKQRDRRRELEDIQRQIDALEESNLDASISNLKQEVRQAAERIAKAGLPNDREQLWALVKKTGVQNKAFFTLIVPPVKVNDDVLGKWRRRDAYEDGCAVDLAIREAARKVLS